MPYCPKCGKEIDENATFCPYCGASTGPSGVEYRRAGRQGWSIGRIIVLVLGGLLILGSLPLLAGGGAVIWVQSSFSDSDGILISRDVRLHADSYAMVFREVNIDMDRARARHIHVNMPTYVWQPKLGDYVTLKLVGTSNDASKELFIGIARDADASEYLRDVEYDEVADFSWSCGPWRESHPQITYDTHQGTAPSGPPIIHSFWVEHVSGPGIQTLEWKPESDSFWFVVMNADGSVNVDLDMQLGVKVPVLRTVGNMLLVGGFVALVVGVIIVYYGAIHRR